MELKNFLIGLIVFSMFTYAISGFLVDMNTYYGAGINTSKIDVYKNQLTNLSQKSEDLRKNTQESGSDVQVSAQWDTSSIGALVGIKDILFNSIPMAYTMFQQLVIDAGLPGWFWAGSFAILVVTVAVLVIRSIFRYEV